MPGGRCRKQESPWLQPLLQREMESFPHLGDAFRGARPERTRASCPPKFDSAELLGPRNRRGGMTDRYPSVRKM